MKKLITVLGLLSAVNIAYADVVSEVEAEITLFDFGDANDKAIRAAAIERFNEKYPNVKVNNQFTPISSWSDYLDKLVTQIAGGQAPDMIHLATEGVQLAVKNNLVVPLDDFVTSNDDVQAIIADTNETLLNGFSSDGKLYFLPASWNNMMIYYNTKIFEEAGIERPNDDWTWDDFLKIAQQLTDTSSNDKKYGFGIPYFNFGLQPFYFSNDASILADDLKTPTIDDPNFIEAVQFIRDLVYEYKVSPDPANTDPNAIFQLFSAGNIGMTGGGHWPMQFFASNDFSDYDILPWPQNKKQATVFGADGWGITPQAENPEIAFALLSELIGEEAQTQAAKADVAIPASTKVATSAEFLAKPKNAALFYQSLDYAMPVTAPAKFSEMEKIVMRYMSLVMADEIAPKKAMQRAAKELEFALE